MKREREEDNAALTATDATDKDVEMAKKEAATKVTGPDAKRRQITATPELIKRQIEYYLSDKNLSQDNLFWNTINDNKVSGSYLPLEKVFGCNKIKMMKRADGSGLPINNEDIKTAVAGSEFVEFGASEDVQAVPGIRRKDPLGAGALPKLEAGSKLLKGAREGGSGDRGLDSETKFHNMGVVFVVDGVPETHTWQEIKKGVKDVLLRDSLPGANGEAPLMSAKSYIDFCSTKTSDGEVFMSASSFPGDMKYFMTHLEFEKERAAIKFWKFSADKAAAAYPEGTPDRDLKLNQKMKNAEGKEVDLVLDESNADFWGGYVKLVRHNVMVTAEDGKGQVSSMQKAQDLMPQFVKEKRLRNQKKAAKTQNVAISIANIRLGSLMELKKKIREIQGNNPDGTEIRKGGTDYNLLKELLLKWHPTGAKKLEGELGIAIGQSAHNATRCFYIIKKRDHEGKVHLVESFQADAVHEDFSMTKIYKTMEDQKAWSRPEH